MAIKHVLLALLRDGPNTASGLQHRFAEETTDLWPLNIGQVAQTLRRLERDGLIAPDGMAVGPTGRQAEQFCLTAEGRTELDGWWQAGIDKPTPDRDELVIKFSLAAQRAANQTGGRSFVELLDHQRFTTLRELRELGRELEGVAPQRTAARLALERHIFELEAQSRWLDRVESLQPPTGPQPNPAKEK